MGSLTQIQTTAAEWLSQNRPDAPVFFYSQAALHSTLCKFQRDFPGEVTYAVKANPLPEILRALGAGGMTSFDTASPAEMAQVRAQVPNARLHYHNPVRSRDEIDAARRFGVASWSVDRPSELDKLGNIQGQEIAVRLKLPVKGAAYDFGEKFGACPDVAAGLLRAVAARGGIASMTFHPGTQCDSPDPWVQYLETCAQIVRKTGVCLRRLNVGGGFAAHRGPHAPDLAAVCNAIGKTVETAFGPASPALVCEPGRAMVAEALTLALRIKAISDEAVFLNDGLYGSLLEWRDLPVPARLQVFSPNGAGRQGALAEWTAFGPTCDSLDRLPRPLCLPNDLQEGDYLMVSGMGAYSQCLASSFNGYGVSQMVDLDNHNKEMAGHWRYAI